MIKKKKEKENKAGKNAVDNGRTVKKETPFQLSSSLAPSLHAPSAFFFPFPTLPTTQRSLYGGETRNFAPLLIQKPLQNHLSCWFD